MKCKKFGWRGVLMGSLVAAQACTSPGSAVHKTIQQDSIPRKPQRTQASVLIAAHRGASGYFPEHTLESYAAAMTMGADLIEPDVVVTKDGVLIARHENELSDTTDVAMKFPERKTTKRIDGKDISGFFSEDFLWSEIQTLRAKERLSFRDQSKNGLYRVPRLEEVVALVESYNKTNGTRVGLYPETKHSVYFESIGLPIEPSLLSVLDASWFSKNPELVYIQSFEVENLMKLSRMQRIPYRRMFLVDRKDRSPVYSSSYPGQKRSYGEWLSLQGMKDLSGFVFGIAVRKDLLVRESAMGAVPSDVVSKARQHDLAVHTWTLREERQFVLPMFKSASEELTFLVSTGISGFFADFPDKAYETLVGIESKGQLQR